jgi:DNA-binding XRE family transcriptional regulator
MRTSSLDAMPPRLRRSLTNFGADIAIARRKRNLTMEMLAERVGVAKATYQRIEKGDPGVSMGAYAMTLFVLGFPDALAVLVDASHDDTGLLLEAQRLPKRVRVKKEPTTL